MARRLQPYMAALVAALALAQPAGAEPAGLCDAARKPANLDFTLADTRGRPVRLDSFRGKVVVVNFWATWCKPCRTEIPWLIELHRLHRNAGLAVVGVSVDEDVARIAPFVSEMHVSYPVLVGRGEEAFAEAFGPLLGFPTTVLIARDGTICARHTGITTRETLERTVRALLDAAPRGQ